MELSYILNEWGEDRQSYQGSVSPPLYQSSNFCFPDIAKMRASLAHEMDIPFYTRGHNPTVAILRKKLAALEGTEEALVFGSGSAAIAAAVMHCVKGGDHVICVAKPYSWTNKLLNKLLAKYGVEATMIDGTDIAHWEAAVQANTRLLFMESPNSMTFELQDIKAVCALAKRIGAATIIDNSYSTPLFQQPAQMGVDIVVHSGSKYLSGHSDQVAGVLCTSRERAEQIFESEYMTLGGIMAPNEAWLMLRGLRTLPMRMQRVSETTEKIVAFLESHPRVARMIYPHSSSHPQYELAKKQMKQGAGQFSVELKADSIEEVERFCDALKRFMLACSWGGYESLIFPICVLYSSQNYGETELPWNFIRFYVGFEEPHELIEDLERGFAAMEG